VTSRSSTGAACEVVTLGQPRAGGAVVCAGRCVDARAWASASAFPGGAFALGVCSAGSVS